jgi:excisionase family DNA binding protein
VHVMPIDRQQYLTTAEVSKALAVSQDTVRRWARKGRVQAVQLPGGHWIIHRDVITAPPK